MSMDLDDLRSSLRYRIGNPPRDGEGAVNDRTLDEFLYRGLEWLAGEFGFSITTSTTGITLVAGTQEYTLPADCAEIIWVEHNTKRLTPKSTFQWDREGNDWRDVTDGTPTEFAVEGRKIIFSPAPDATAVSDDSTPDFRYFATAPALSSSGIDRLGDQEHILAVYWAGWQYSLLHASEDPAFNSRAKANEAALMQGVAQAQRRWHERIADYRPTYGVRTRRQGGAR